MPYISVVVPTLRVGGLDILFSGLENQTFKDFELVLVDSIYKHRKDLVAEKASQYSFKIKHVEPIDNPFPLNSYQRCVNTGIANSSGKVAYFTCDYSWLPPNCLDGHAKFHQNIRDRSAMLGPCHLLDLPPINFPFLYGLDKFGSIKGPHKDEVLAKWDNETIRHEATKEWCESYFRDLNNGILDPYMWSIFAAPFLVQDSPLHLPILHEEMKKSMPEGYSNPQYCHLKNDSIALEALLEVNGFDERYDGSHGWQDTEIATRLTARTGMRWYIKPDNLVHVTDVHGIMIIRKMLRSEHANEQLYLCDNPRNYPEPVNTDRDWKSVRNQILGLSL